MQTLNQRHNRAENPAEFSADVLVIGAGPTGLLLTNLLGSMGVSVCLVEKNTGTVREPRAVSIDDESMRALQAAGIAEDVTAISVQGYGSIYKGPSGKVFASVKPTSNEYGFAKRNAFEQPHLEAVLRTSLGRFSAVTTYFDTELVAFEQDSNGVAASLITADGKAMRVDAQYMVACDGGRSGVRKSLGIDMVGTTFQEPWLIVDLFSSRNRCFHTEVSCDPARPYLTLPGPNGIRRYEFMLHAHEDQEEATGEEFVRKLLSHAGPDGEQSLRRVQVYTFHARLAERWRVGRVFLAGDAAHLTPPFAGQGMNSGLRDAHNLAWKLSEAISSESLTQDFLDSYQDERKPHAWSMIKLALRMGRVMMPSSPLRAKMVRAGFKALSVYPGAREYFAQMRYKPKPRFEAGLIWPDGRHPRKTLAGRMFPQPLVETTARERVLFDSLLEDQNVLVIYSEHPESAVGKDIVLAFEEAGTKVIGLTPEWMNPTEAEFPIVRDAGRAFAAPPLSAYLEHAILLRRDRYVASTRSVGAVHELLDLIPLLAPGRERTFRS